MMYEVMINNFTMCIHILYGNATSFDMQTNQYLPTKVDATVCKNRELKYLYQLVRIIELTAWRL